MRIVSKKEFLTLPSGTIFAPFHNRSTERSIDFSVGDLCIKYDSLPDINDFVYATIVHEFNACSSEDLDVKEDVFLNGNDVPLTFDGTAREGYYDDTTQYAVWNQKEVEGLIAVLQKGLQLQKEKPK